MLRQSGNGSGTGGFGFELSFVEVRCVAMVSDDALPIRDAKMQGDMYACMFARSACMCRCLLPTSLRKMLFSTKTWTQCCPRCGSEGGFWEEISLESLKGRSLLTKPLPPSRLKITRDAPGGEQAEGVGATGGWRGRELRSAGLTTLAGLTLHRVGAERGGRGGGASAGYSP